MDGESSFLSVISRGVSRDVRSQLGQRARRCARKYVPYTRARMCGAACGRPFGRLFARVHRHTHTRYNRTPQTRTYVHTRPSRATRERAKRPWSKPFPEIARGRVDWRFTAGSRARAIESLAGSERTVKKLKTQSAQTSIDLHRFDSDLTRGQILSTLRFNCCASTLVKYRALILRVVGSSRYRFHFYALLRGMKADGCLIN